jgi:hypothetical protein
MAMAPSSLDHAPESIAEGPVNVMHGDGFLCFQRILDQAARVFPVAESRIQNNLRAIAGA